MYCRKCGAKNVDQAKYCAKCGCSLVNNQPKAINNKESISESNRVIDSNKVPDTKNKKKLKMLVAGLIILCIATVGTITYKVLINKLGSNIGSKDKQRSSDIGNSEKNAKNSTIVSGESVVKEIDNNSLNSPSISSKSDKQVAENVKVNTDFILPNSSTVELQETELGNLTKEQLALARNEVYARHGLVFNTQYIKSYFESKSWYHADPSYKGDISNIENFNIQLIKKIEDSKSNNLDQKELSMIGTINSNLNVHMKLNFNKNEISGTYYYDKYNTQSLKLSGVYDKDNNISMNELDSNGSITGVFNGIISPSGKFIGNWSSPDGTKKFPFAINSSN